MKVGRAIGAMLLALAGLPGCASTSGPVAGAAAAPPAAVAPTAPEPVRVEPSQIFNMGTQSP